MKRSEMIQAIAEVIEPVLYERFDAHKEAEYILQIIEKKGMLPPFSYLKTLGVLDTAWEPEENK